MMSANSVVPISSASLFSLQELCDGVVDKLSDVFVEADSLIDLRSIALVSPNFRDAAQRVIFSDVSIQRQGTGYKDEEATWMRFLATMRTSPHLLRYVKSLTAPVEDRIIGGLSVLELPNLQRLAFDHLNHPDKDISYLAIARMIAFPTIRSVSFIHLDVTLALFLGLFKTFTPRITRLGIHGVHDEAQSSANVAFNLESVQISALRIANMPLRPGSDWILDPLCPFEFGSVRELVLGANMVAAGDSEYAAMLAAILDRVRNNLEELIVQDQQYMTSLVSLANLHSLRALCININNRHLLELLLPLLPSPSLRDLSLIIHYDEQSIEFSPILKLSSVMTTNALPVLRNINLVFIGIDSLDAETTKGIQGALISWMNAGKLSINCVVSERRPR
ncbi:hypothetical protein R3P38DRAFT_3284426 [Favolaschia claudopus]|uniref:F-box domain-containing protein n=1 Tax=Favolaschia claudopus TaxID=2862362 RepID=A0AAW0A5J2_9AGAR